MYVFYRGPLNFECSDANMQNFVRRWTKKSTGQCVRWFEKSTGQLKNLPAFIRFPVLNSSRAYQWSILETFLSDTSMHCHNL